MALNDMPNLESRQNVTKKEEKELEQLTKRFTELGKRRKERRNKTDKAPTESDVIIKSKNEKLVASVVERSVCK